MISFRGSPHLDPGQCVAGWFRYKLPFPEVLALVNGRPTNGLRAGVTFGFPVSLAERQVPKR